MKLAKWYWTFLALACFVVLVATIRWYFSNQDTQGRRWSEIEEVRAILNEYNRLAAEGSKDVDEISRLLERAWEIQSRWVDDNAVQLELRAMTNLARTATQERWSVLRQAILDYHLSPDSDAGDIDYNLLSAGNFGLHGTRRVARIAIPLGRSRDDVTETIRSAILEQYSEGHRHIVVFAYRTIDDPGGAFTAGMGELVVRDAGDKSYLRQVPIVTIELARSYQDGDPRDLYPAGSVWSLSGGTVSEHARFSATMDTVLFSSKPERWTSADIVGRVQVGTRVEVVEVRFFPTTLGDLIRIRVRTIRENEDLPAGFSPRPEVEGWVSAEYLTPLESSP